MASHQPAEQDPNQQEEGGASGHGNLAATQRAAETGPKEERPNLTASRSPSREDGTGTRSAAVAGVSQCSSQQPQARTGERIPRGESVETQSPVSLSINRTANNDAPPLYHTLQATPLPLHTSHHTVTLPNSSPGCHYCQNSHCHHFGAHCNHHLVNEMLLPGEIQYWNPYDPLQQPISVSFLL